MSCNYLIIQKSICFLTSWENVRPCVPYVVKFRHCARSVGRGPRVSLLDKRSRKSTVISQLITFNRLYYVLNYKVVYDRL